MKCKYLAFFAALALLASCSKEDAPDPKAWVHDETLPVPVMFSMPKAMIQSKARITGTSLDGQRVGVMAVSRGSGSWETATSDLVLLCNAPATVKDDNDGNAGTLDFDNGNTVYYPMTNDRTFSFYGYYPRGAIQLSDGGGLFTVEYTNLGQTDILWAESQATELDGIQGFNARYVRNVEQNHASEAATYLPHLEFEHKLTALKFTVQAVGTAVEGLKVRRIIVKNVPTTVTLWVANKSDSEDGKYSGRIFGGSDRGDIPVLNSIGSNPNVPVTATETDAGEVMLLPQATYNVEVETQINNGSVQTIKGLTLTIEGGSFEAGKVYGYKVLVTSPSEVKFVAVSLKDWEDGFAGGTPEDLQIGE